MTEQELRVLVREAIARHGAGGTAASLFSGAAEGVTTAGNATRFVQQHASHGMFVLPTGADSDGPCIIEPAVPCTHCGYCKSYGH